jgi:hypothetical protein
MDATLNPSDAAPIEIRTEGPGWLSNTPWWFVSAGLHLVLLLIATLVTIERYMATDGGGVSVNVTPRREMAVLELIRDVPYSQQPPGLTDQPAPVEPVRDPEIHAPLFEVGTHNESDEGIDGDTMKGQSEEARGSLWGDKGGFKGRSNQPGQGIYESMGVGGGGGMPWRFGNGPGGRRNIRAVGSIGKPPPDTENAVTAALKWLARHQNPDGSWGATNHVNHCVGAKCAGVGDESYDTGLTSLAILAYLGAGYTHLSKDEHDDAMNPGRKLRFGEVVKSGLKWLMTRQDPEGCVGGRGTKYMYNHTIAALALSEAFGMTATMNFRGPAQQAIDFLVAAQNPDRGWRYTKQCGDNDTSVTGWAVMALKSAELSDLSVPAAAYEKARRWLDEATEPSGYYRVGYNARNSGKVFVPGKNDSYVHHESMTAVGVLCRIFMRKDKRDPALGGVALLVADLPVTKTDWTDYYYWYYGSLALFQYDGPNGPHWKKWEAAMRDALVPHQKTGKDGCANGSWSSDDERWGFEGGRVYATAINALTLEVYYRYPNVFGTK